MKSQVHILAISLKNNRKIPVITGAALISIVIIDLLMTSQILPYINDSEDLMKIHNLKFNTVTLWYQLPLYNIYNKKFKTEFHLQRNKYSKHIFFSLPITNSLSKPLLPKWIKIIGNIINKIIWWLVKNCIIYPNHRTYTIIKSW